MLSPRAQRLVTAYADSDLQTLLSVQRVHVTDYYRYRAEGLSEAAGAALEAVNALGEVIDQREGTQRVAAEPQLTCCDGDGYRSDIFVGCVEHSFGGAFA